MANASSPTAANIISSLCVKGAKVLGGSAADAGFVPVLGVDGKLDSSVIPDIAVSGVASIKALADAAFVDPVYVSPPTSNGSIAAPYTNIAAAVASGKTTIVLCPGTYGNNAISGSAESNSISFSNKNKVIFLGLGICKVEGMYVSGINTSGAIVFHDIEFTAAVTVSGSVTAICSGSTSATAVNGPIQNSDDPLSTSSLVLKVGPCARVGSTNASSVSGLANTSHVDNDSSVVGNTAKDALNRLGGRKVRVKDISYEDGELIAGDSVDISAAADQGGFDVIDLSSRIAGLVDILNENFLHGGGNPEFSSLSVENDLTVGKMVSASRVKVADSLLIVDSITGETYQITMENGRMCVSPVTDGSSSSDSSSSS